MMSATILNREGFCKTLGVKEEDCSFISIPSPFPPENHPIFAYPIAKMSAGTIDSELPKLAQAVKAILEQHPSDKGVIHCIEENETVMTADGLGKRLLDVQAGDKIVTWSEERNQFEIDEVVENWDKGTQNCIKIHFENGKTLTCTPEHRILTKNRGWVEAQDIVENDDIMSL